MKEIDKEKLWELIVESSENAEAKQKLEEIESKIRSYRHHVFCT